MNLIKIFLTFILLLISTYSYSQKDTLRLSFEDNLNGSYSMHGIGTMSIGFAGENSVERGKTKCSMVTNYSLSMQKEITSNELLHKTNISYGNLFLLDVYSSSMVRSIIFDNSFGLGYAKKFSIKNNDFSISYAVLYQETSYNSGSKFSTFRNSFRARLRREGESVGVYSEIYYQPRFGNVSDYIIYVNSKIVLNPKKKVSFLIQDAINYISVSNIKMIHTLSFGIGFSIRSKK
jgi:hypothetical protein